MVDPAAASDSGLTLYEQLTVLGVIVGVLLTAIGVLMSKLYTNLREYIGAVSKKVDGVSWDLKLHADEDKVQARILNRFIGAISQKLKISVPSE